MPEIRKYQVIMGNNRDVNQQLDSLAVQGWRAISISSTINSIAATSQVQISVLMEFIGTAG